MKKSKRTRARSPRTLSFEQLEEWLDNLDPPGPGVSMIDGFLAALIVSPRFIHPDEWMWHIIGDQAQWALEGTIEAAAANTIVARYNEISTALSERPKAYAPIYMRTDAGEVLLEDWANGFFGAMRLAMDDWQLLVSDPETGGPLGLLVGHSTQTGGPSLVGLLTDKGAPGALADTWKVVPDIVAFLYNRSADARNASSR